MAEGEHFVDKHQVNLIKRVINIAPILDELLHENIIQQDSYDEIKALPTSQEKMTALFSGPLESSGGRGKEMFYRFLNKHEPYLIVELRRTDVPVETMMIKELLLKSLNDLSPEELKKFRWLLQFNFLLWGLPQISWRRLHRAHRTDHLVDEMMEIWGQQSVEVTKEVFMDMNRTDLVQRLSETSSGPKEKHTVDEHWPELIQKVETMASDIELLLETLAGLSDGELEEFKHVLWSLTDFHSHFSDIPLMMLEVTDKQDMVFLMVLIYGRQSVNKTKKVLKKMNRTDLVPRLSHRGSGPKKKLSDEHRSALIQRVATKAAVKQLLLETLGGIEYWKLKKFKEFLQLIVSQKKLPDISSMLRQTANREKTVDLMMQTYGHQSVDLTREVVEKMNRTDLMWRWSESSSPLEGPSRSLDHEDCGSFMISSDWTKLQPEVNSKDVDEAPTYSLQSEAGHFECSLSGLRWICKGKVRFQYQFCPWEEPMERMKRKQYMPAGPLINITVIAGKLDEVHLPHWICIDDNPKILDKFAVLHIDDCGDVVEKVSEVTSSHVKLCEPVFSPRAVLMRVGFSVKINCNVLIYKTNTAFLTLHVYLIPRDPGLQQELDKREISYGYKVIRKPHPEKSLKIKDRFILTAVLEGAETNPEVLKLRYDSRTPNFFEVYAKNPDTDFAIKLNKKTEHQPVWTCTIRKDEYQSIPHVQGEHFVDKHRCDLIERVSNINTILDNLLTEGVVSQEDYDTMSVIPTTQEKMRKLYRGPLKAAGHDGKDVFYKILEEKESYLVADLKRKGS